MKLIKSIFTLTIIASITGCATTNSSNTPEDFAKRISIKNSEFDKEITFVGSPIYTVTKRGLFEDNETTRIVAFQSKTTGKVQYSLYISVMYMFDWRFYKSISLKDTTTIQLKSISQKVNFCQSIGCNHTEEMGANIPLETLDSSKDFIFRLNSTSGKENIITIPYTYVAGTLAGIKSNLK